MLRKIGKEKKDEFLIKKSNLQYLGNIKCADKYKIRRLIMQRKDSKRSVKRRQLFIEKTENENVVDAAQNKFTEQLLRIIMMIANINNLI